MARKFSIQKYYFDRSNDDKCAMKRMQNSRMDFFDENLFSE